MNIFYYRHGYEGIDALTINQDFVMQMRASRQTRAANDANNVPLLDLVADMNVDRIQMSVDRAHTAGMLDNDGIAVICVVPGQGNPAGQRYSDLLVTAGGQVNTGVKLLLAGKRVRAQPVR